MTQLEFSREARTELDAAADHYERDYRGRGLRFYDAVERAMRLIAMLPNAAPLFPAVPEALAVRRRLVPGFPFALATGWSARPCASRRSSTLTADLATGLSA
ncbi:MAG: hypothetical protein IPL61_27455 [Myxococcales bacterium]|nr:hypothetical protein [Myxococcales bacterium]